MSHVPMYRGLLAILSVNLWSQEICAYIFVQCQCIFHLVVLLQTNFTEPMKAMQDMLDEDFNKKDDRDR